MRAFFYSPFIFRNGQNAIPSILLPGAESRIVNKKRALSFIDNNCCGLRSDEATYMFLHDGIRKYNDDKVLCTMFHPAFIT